MSAPVFLSDEEEWQKFKAKFNKSYEPEEEAKRFGIFQENVQRMREHNEKFTKGETTYTKGINNFADLTTDEFKSRHTGLVRPQK